MRKIKLFNFHDLILENCYIEFFSSPIRGFKRESDCLYIVIVREPVEYFNFLLNKLMQENSNLEIIQKMKLNLSKMEEEEFIKWLKSLNFTILYNPQTFHLDSRKRVKVAVKNLEKFDYVLPYVYIKQYLNEKLNCKVITKDFSMYIKNKELIKDFIYKDEELYNVTTNIWEQIETNNYQSFVKLSCYKGIVDKIEGNIIGGWIVKKGTDESLNVEIYKNDKLIRKVKADLFRKDLFEQKIHPTGKCGFLVRFNKEVFKPGDDIKVKIQKIGYCLRLGEKVVRYLKGEINEFCN